MIDYVSTSTSYLQQQVPEIKLNLPFSRAARSCAFVRCGSAVASRWTSSAGSAEQLGAPGGARKATGTGKRPGGMCGTGGIRRIALWLVGGVVALTVLDAAPERGEPRGQGCVGEWLYACALVDLDPKPLAKMPGYLKQDRAICALYASLEAAGKLV